MSQLYDGMFDVLLSYDTDVAFKDGDLMLTSGIDYIEREIYKLLVTSPGDWRACPQIGCSPEEFIGEPNSQETANRIQTFLQNGLMVTVHPAQTSIRVVPTNYSNVMIFIDLCYPDFVTDAMVFEFDFVNGIRRFNQSDPALLIPQSSDNLKLNDISNMKRPNKYWTERTIQYTL